jgi:predicted transcriptional regulator
LKLIQGNPRLRASDLAKMMNREKDALKLDIRKLKNMGLTISHDVGYSISPLGEIVLTSVDENNL